MMATTAMVTMEKTPRRSQSERNFPKWTPLAVIIVGLSVLLLGWFLGQRATGAEEERVTAVAETSATAGQALDLASAIRGACDAGTIPAKYQDACAKAVVVQARPVPAVPGAKGADGSNGANGINGLDGLPGGIGPSGLPGLPGETGVPGPQGEPGLQGAAGAPGPAGADGAAGPAGPQGEQGPQGATGPQGPPGPTCPEGSSPEEIVVLTDDGPETITACTT
jgi:hypothetical protein